MVTDLTNVTTDEGEMTWGGRKDESDLHPIDRELAQHVRNIKRLNNMLRRWFKAYPDSLPNKEVRDIVRIIGLDLKWMAAEQRERAAIALSRQKPEADISPARMTELCIEHLRSLKPEDRATAMLAASSDAPAVELAVLPAELLTVK